MYLATWLIVESCVLFLAVVELMIAQKVTKAEMARRLEGFQTSADRILSIKHSTKLETLEAAFAALGKHLDLRVA